MNKTKELLKDKMSKSKEFITYTKTISTERLPVLDLELLVGAKDARLLLEQANEEFSELYRQKLIAYLGDYVVVPEDF